MSQYKTLAEKQAEKNFVTLYWHVEDVQDAAPHLTEAAARAVLHQLAELHDPTVACITPESVGYILESWKA